MRTSTVCFVALLMLTGCPDSDSAGGTNTGQPDAGPDIDMGGDTGDPDTDDCVPQAETCNGQDDDCDGAVDNGFDLAGDPDHCGACGFVCDLPNAQPSCNAGSCVVGICDDGFFDTDGVAENGCEATQCEPTGDEVCDGADNNCDGEVDEGFDVGSNPAHCAACGDVCEVPGATAECESGVCAIADCDEGFGDANGTPDDGCECTITNDGVEACDDVDNDCNGVIDDDIALDVVERCGACDIQCSFPNGVPACEDMACVMTGCLEGYVDLDTRADTGCEYACAPEVPSDQDLACDGEDNDCDGEVDNDTGEGDVCALAEGLEGLLTCTEQGLLCQTEASEGPVDICGPIAGVLTAQGGPYRVVCPELVIEDGAMLLVEPGAVIETGLPDDDPVRLRVVGALQTLGAAWRGVGIALDGGDATLAGDLLAATGGEILLDATGPGSLSSTDVTLRGPGHGLSVAGSPDRVSIVGGALVGLEIGVRLATDAPLALAGVTFENNGIAIQLDSGAAGVGVILEGGALRATIGPPQIGIQVAGDEADTIISLADVRVAQRDIDAVVELDPDQLRGLQGTAILLSDVPNRIRLIGDLDRADAALIVLGDLHEYEAPDGISIAAVRVLSGAADTVLEGLGTTVNVDGTFVVAGTLVRNLYFRPSGLGTVDLTDARTEITLEALEGCLLQAPADATLLLDNAVIAQEPIGISPALEGICLPSPTSAQSWDGALVRGFATGIRMTDAAAFDISGLQFEDDTIALDWQGATLGTISDNQFRSTPQRQVLAMRLRTGAAPGGAVRGNTFDHDTGDFVLDIDPDCLTEAGTTFGPNTYQNSQTSSYLLGGTLDAGDLVIRDLTERPQEDAFFLTVQIREDILVSQDASFTVEPGGRQIVTIQGLGTAQLTVEGELSMHGPGVFASELPIAFEPGSGGVIAAVALSSSRSDRPLVTIDEAEPTIGGNSQFDEVQITGSNLRDAIGVEIHSQDPMCQVLENLCPFIANNTFRNLAIGVLAHRPANFSGVNDFDDADGDDSVAVNVELR
jgi:hypothetical protein